MHPLEEGTYSKSFSINVDIDNSNVMATRRYRQYIYTYLSNSQS